MAIVKKGFVDMENVDSELTKKIMNDATLTDKKKSNAGRKKKSENDKATEMMAVYFTVEQKEVIQAYCDKISIPFSTLVKQLLSEKGIL